VLADPACGTSVWSLTVAQARSRRGAELEANDRDSRGYRFARWVSLTLPLARPHREPKVVSSDNPTQAPRDAKRKAGTAAAGRWLGAPDADS
jgi:hypothetical protein